MQVASASASLTQSTGDLLSAYDNARFTPTLLSLHCSSGVWYSRSAGAVALIGEGDWTTFAILRGVNDLGLPA